MPRATQQPTELERKILQVLWNQSSLPVREVRQRLAAAGRELAHTSVITMLNIMVRKGFLKRSRQGNALLFAPKVERESMSRRLVRGLVDRVFDGSTVAVVHCPLDSAELTAEELGEIRQLLNRKGKERIWPVAASLLLGALLAISALTHPEPTKAAPPGETPATASAWGQPSGGLTCRIACVSRQTDEQQPDFAKAARTDRFARVEEITLLAELKNVGDKPLLLQGTRYGDSVTLPWPGKSNSAEFAPQLFSYELFDKAGKPLERPLRNADDTDAMLRLSGGTAETIAPGKSLVVLLRPADGDTGLASRLSGGEYQIRVRYHGPLPGVHKQMLRAWPEKPLARVWSGDVASGLVPLSLANSRRAELAWGPAKEGLRAAVEFLPIAQPGAAANAADDSIPLGGRADVRVHLQNAGKKDISLWSETWRQDDTVYRVEADGKETELGHSWYSGWPTMEHWVLKPGQSAVIAAIDLGAAADEKSAKAFEHPVGPIVIGPPGTYRMRYEIHLGRLQSTSPDGKTKIPGPGDWQGTLSTGITSIAIRPRRAGDDPPTFTARLRLQAPDGKPVTAGHVEVRVQSGYRELLNGELGPGPIEVPNCPHGALSLYVRAGGFEETRYYDVMAKPGETTALTLRPAQPTRFRLVTRDGKPVTDAMIRYFVRSKADAGAGPYPMEGLHGSIWATPDAQGNVVLDMLEKFDPQDRKLGNDIYFFFIESRGLAPRFLGPIQAGENLGNVTVGPLLEARGEIRGTPAELAAFSAEWDQPEPMRRGNGEVGWQYAESQALKTQREGDHLTFHLTNLRPGKLRIVSRFKRGGKPIGHVYSRREPNEDDVVFETELTDSRRDLVIVNRPGAKASPPAKKKDANDGKTGAAGTKQKLGPQRAQPAPVAGASVAFSGRVTDEQGRPVPGAEVFLQFIPWRK